MVFLSRFIDVVICCNKRFWICYMLGKSALKGCIFMVLTYTWNRVYFLGFPYDIRMKISEILDRSDHLHTHVEETQISIETTLAHILRISIGAL